jgi:hypothetical protein
MSSEQSANKPLDVLASSSLRFKRSSPFLKLLPLPRLRTSGLVPLELASTTADRYHWQHPHPFPYSRARPSDRYRLRALPALPSGPTRVSVNSRSYRTYISRGSFKLTSNLCRSCSIQTAIGGTSLDKDLKGFRNGRADVLVATPGRLLDHIENHGLSQRLSGVKFVVLDEADRLLEQVRSVHLPNATFLRVMPSAG